jgi:hypothetical protein
MESKEVKKMHLLLKIARKVFACESGVLSGLKAAAFPAKGKDVEIGVVEMPKVIVAGIALGIGLEPTVIGESSAMDLGETQQQLMKNLSYLKKKYDLAAKELMSASPDYSFKVYALKHNQIARRFNEALGNKITPDFPYTFVREREIAEK